MRRILTAIMGVGAVSLSTSGGSRPPSLIPLPAKMTSHAGVFVITGNTPIVAGRAERSAAVQLAATARRVLGLDLPIQARAANGAIRLRLDPTLAALGKEGYTLEVAPEGVRAAAGQPAGLFYAVQTLCQLLPVHRMWDQKAFELPCVSIEDQPRFAWRGFMLDSSRHFVKKSTILALLDALALVKINVFHWHLVDDNAWRLAISKYPRLVRPAPIKLPWYEQAAGFYSRRDVAEIVRRASDLHITIVPEIEMPSHATQAASVLPEASCLGTDGKPLPPGTTREICLGSDRAIEALQDILVEVMAMFPNSPSIHLGGDEAEDVHWRACSRCQARMAQLGLKDPRLLQKWFMDKMSGFVRDHGRTSIAWADRLALGIPEGQIVHGWHGGELQEAVAKGHLAIQSQHDYTYFDYSQGPGDTAFGGASLPIERVYALDPVVGLPPDRARLVLGPQAQLWTELVTDDHVMAKAFPRVLALAEVGWSPQSARNVREFAWRLADFILLLDSLAIPSFRPPVVLGEWRQTDMAETWKNLDWDVTAHMPASAKLGVRLLYQRGAHALDIDWVALLENGVEVSRDRHTGRTGADHRNNTYRVGVAELKPGAIYTLRARVKSDGGTDSTGLVLVNP